MATHLLIELGVCPVTTIFCVTLMIMYAAAKRFADILSSKRLFWEQGEEFIESFVFNWLYFSTFRPTNYWSNTAISFFHPLLLLSFLSSSLLFSPFRPFLSFQLLTFRSLSPPLLSCSFIPQLLSTGNSNLGISQTAMWMYNSFTSFPAKSLHYIMKHIHQREENQIAVNQSVSCLSVFSLKMRTLWGLTRYKSLIKWNEASKETLKIL